MTTKVDGIVDDMIQTAIHDLERQCHEAHGQILQCQMAAAQESIDGMARFRAGLADLLQHQYGLLKQRIEDAYSACYASGGAVGGEPTDADRAERDRKLSGVFQDGDLWSRRWSQTLGRI
jgi:hypothetical protein